MNMSETEEAAGVGHSGGPPIEEKTLDLIWGIEGIGEVIGRTYSQTYHLVRAGKLPMVKQIGERYVASRRKLVAFFMDDAA